MLEPAAPQHRLPGELFLAVRSAVSAYVAAVVCVVLGLATGVTGVAVAVSAVLLVAFRPVLRRLHPDRPE